MGLGKLPWFERATLGASAVTLGVVLSSWGLMRFSAYSLARAMGLALIVVAAGVTAAIVAGRGKPRSEAPRESWHAAVALALCVGFGALYAAYPTYFLLGGQDPGPYLAFSARIAKTGGLGLEVPELARWAGAHGLALIREFPAVYGRVESDVPAAAQAQFVHLFTAFTANFFALGGVEGAVRVNAWPAVLCLASGFALLRRIGSRRAAFAYLVALGVNPAFVWASRITLTEMLGLWLNLTGLFLLVLAWDLECLTFGALAGAVFGIGVLNRLDGGLGAFAVFGFAVAALVGEKTHRRAALAAALALLVTSVLAYCDDYALSPIYCEAIATGSSTGKLLPVVTSALGAGALGLSLLPPRLSLGLRLNETTLRLWSYGAAWCIAFWLAFGLLVRPLIDTSEAATLVRELGWYLGWSAWPLLLLGLALALRAASFRRLLPLVVLTIGTLFIYTSRNDVAPVHIWASRRWVPHVIPLALACAALGADWLIGRARPGVQRVAAALIVGAALLGPPVNFSRVFLFDSMLRGLPQAYERVAEFGRKHRDKWPLVTAQVHYGSILTYVYDVPTVVLNETGQERFAEGDMAGGVGVGFSPFALRHVAEDPHGYVGPYLNPARGVRPDEIVDQRYELSVGEIGPKVFDVEMPAGHSGFREQVGDVMKDGSVKASGPRGGLHYGPWCALGPGTYRIEWYGRAESAPKGKRLGTFEVIYANGEEPLVEAPLRLEDRTGKEVLLQALDFKVKSYLEGVQFRTRLTERRVGLSLTRLRLRRLGEP